MFARFFFASAICTEYKLFRFGFFFVRCLCFSRKPEKRCGAMRFTVTVTVTSRYAQCVYEYIYDICVNMYLVENLHFTLSSSSPVVLFASIASIRFNSPFNLRNECHLFSIWIPSASPSASSFSSSILFNNVYSFQSIFR